MPIRRAHLAANNDRLWRSSACNFIAVVCASLLICAGCSGSPPPQHPLPDLHIPGVSKVPHGDQVAQQIGSHQISAITTYAAASGGHADAAHILASGGGHVFDIGVDGSAFHEIPLTVPCSDELSVTADSQWGVCQSEHGIEVFGLNGPSKGQSREVLRNPAGEVLRTPTWAPDGRHLAAASHLTGAWINIYTISPTYDTLQLTARLTVAFAEVDAEINSVWWSADGDWISFLGGPVSGGSRLYLVHVGPLLPRLFGHEHAPVTMFVRSDQMSAAQGSSPLTWHHPILPHGGAANPPTVTLVGDSGRSIIQQNLATGRQTTLLTQQVGYICGLAWTPDDSKLIFALCGPNTIEYSGPPTVLNTYTPPN